MEQRVSIISQYLPAETEGYSVESSSMKRNKDSSMASCTLLDRCHRHDVPSASEPTANKSRINRLNSSDVCTSITKRRWTPLSLSLSSISRSLHGSLVRSCTRTTTVMTNPTMVARKVHFPYLPLLLDIHDVSTKMVHIANNSMTDPRSTWNIHSSSHQADLLLK